MAQDQSHALKEVKSEGAVPPAAPATSPAAPAAAAPRKKVMNGKPTDSSSLTRQGMDYGETRRRSGSSRRDSTRETRAARRTRAAFDLAHCCLRIGNFYRRRLSRTLFGKLFRQRFGPDDGAASGEKRRRRGRPTNRSKPSYRRATAVKRFSRRIVKPAIRPMAKVFPVNIRRLPAPNSPTAVRVAWE